MRLATGVMRRALEAVAVRSRAHARAVCALFSALVAISIASGILARPSAPLDEPLQVVIRAPSADAADAFAVRLLQAARAAPDLEGASAPGLDPYFLRNGWLLLEPAEVADRLARVEAAAPWLTRVAGEPSLEAHFEGLAAALEAGEPGPHLEAALRGTHAVLVAREQGGSAPFAWSDALLGPPPGGRAERVIEASAARDVVQAAQALQRAVREAGGLRGLESVEARIGGEALRRLDRAQKRNRAAALLAAGLITAGLLAVRLALGSWRGALQSVCVLTVSLAATRLAADLAPVGAVPEAGAFLPVGWLALFAACAVLRGAGETGASSPLLGGPATAGLAAAGAFAALAASGAPELASIGAAGLAGVIAAFGAAASLLPALMALAPPEASPATPPAALTPAPAPPRPRLAGALTATALAGLSLAPGVRVETGERPSLVLDAAASGALAQIPARDREESQRIAAAVRREAEAGVVRAHARLDSPEGRTTRARILETGAPVLAALDRPPSLARQAPGTAIARLETALAASDSPAAPPLLASLRRFKARAAYEPGHALAVQSDLLAYWPLTLDRLRLVLSPDPDPSPGDVPAPLRPKFFQPDGGERVDVFARTGQADFDAARPLAARLSARFPLARGVGVEAVRAEQAMQRALAAALVISLLLGAGRFAHRRGLREAAACAATALAAAGLVCAGLSVLGAPATPPALGAAALFAALAWSAGGAGASRAWVSLALAPAFASAPATLLGEAGLQSLALVTTLISLSTMFCAAVILPAAKTLLDRGPASPTSKALSGDAKARAQPGEGARD